MESLEQLQKRIEFGRRVDSEPSKIFFSLQPTLRFALINYLIRKHGEKIPVTLLYFSDLELIKTFDEIAECDEVIIQQIFELYQAIIDYRLITFTKRNGIQSPVARTKLVSLKGTDYYLDILENVIAELSNKV